jgi:glycosyltransferase involved in cell wall biosynthesis
MKIFIGHNAYSQRGGEETVFQNEVVLLRRRGHDVSEFWEDNTRIERLNPFQVAADTLWSRTSNRKIKTALETIRPDIVHFHNTFPLISPSVFYVCSDMGIPIVQTLHNYRLLCPTGMFHRNGSICEDCLHRRLKWPGIVHACYRESRRASAVVTVMLATHDLLGTWATKVDRYIALSEFSRAKFVEGGLPPEKLLVKPNFVASDPGARIGNGDYALFIGRLSSEKGADVLIQAWSKNKLCIPLRIVGDGPNRPMLESISRGSSVRFDGFLERGKVIEAIKGARFLVCANRTYENFPLIIAETYACGVPVLAPRRGAMAELVKHGLTGLNFEPDNIDDLAGKVQWAWTHPSELRDMGRAARIEYETKYTAERNYELLMDVYQSVLATRLAA